MSGQEDCIYEIFALRFTAVPARKKIRFHWAFFRNCRYVDFTTLVDDMSQWQSNLALLYPVADLGVGPGGPGPPVFLDQTEASKDWIKFVWRPSPLSQDLDASPPPLIWRSGPATAFHTLQPPVAAALIAKRPLSCFLIQGLDTKTLFEEPRTLYEWTLEVGLNIFFKPSGNSSVQRWKYALLTKREAKWPDIGHFLFCVFIDRDKVDTYTRTYMAFI